MEIFVGIKNDLCRMGCLQYDHPYKKIINLFIICFNFSFLFICTASSLWFFLYEAQTFTNYSESFNIVLSGLMVFFTYISLLLQQKELLELITEFECIIDSRKCIPFFNFAYFYKSYNFFILFISKQGDRLLSYEASNVKIEKWTKMKNVVTMILVISYVMPNCFAFLYGYFFTDSPDGYYRLSLSAT